MKRILWIVLCGLTLVGSIPGSARADRRVYDTPGDGRPVVGDDDEPAVQSPPVQEQPRTATPAPSRPTRTVGADKTVVLRGANGGDPIIHMNRWWSLFVVRVNSWAVAWKAP